MRLFLEILWTLGAMAVVVRLGVGLNEWRLSRLKL